MNANLIFAWLGDVRFALGEAQVAADAHRGPIHPHSCVPANADEAWGAKHLIRKQYQANLPSNGIPLGECRNQYSGGIATFRTEWSHVCGATTQAELSEIHWDVV